MKKTTIISALILMMVMMFSGCVDAEKKVMEEKREYVSTSLYKDLMDNNILSINDHVQLHLDLSNYVDKNKEKYVCWLIEATAIHEDKTVRNMLTPDGDGTYIKCKFDYDYGDKIKEGKEFVVSGKIEEFNVWDSELILTNCRVEKINDAQLKQMKKDKEAYYNKVNGGNKVVEEKVPVKILGSTRDQVSRMFTDYEVVEEYEKNVDANAVKFQNDNLAVIIFFDKNQKAEGVAYLSSVVGVGKDGKNSYVNTHYNELVKLAAGSEKVKIEKDVSSKYPLELYIGNTHD